MQRGTLIFEIPGKPFGKARPRTGPHGMYNPRVNKDYERRVREAYLQASHNRSEPTDGPIAIIMSICFLPPKSVSKITRRDMLEGKIYPTMRPDIDNCAKSILDGLNGIAYTDDKQVVALVINKRYDTESKIIVEIGEV